MYKLIKDTITGEITSVKLLSEELFIPFAPGNRHYQEYQDWLAAGNEPLPADELGE